MTALDTNVIVTLLTADDVGDRATALAALERASDAGRLIVAPVVYAELLAGPQMEEGFLEDFMQRTQIHVDWRMPRDIWRQAGLAYKSYAERRRNQRGEVAPRRILADFLIGAHAQAHGAHLLTFDGGMFRQAFPSLNVLLLEPR